MRIAVIGAGAMGGLFGGRLAAAGADVVLVDVAEAHLRAMAEHGLLLDTDEGARRVRVQAGRPERFAGVRDLLIVFTKGPATGTAVRAAAHLAGPDTRVLTVQNGLGNADAIRAALPDARILVGMTSWPADLVAPGHVVSHGHGEVRIWPEDGAADGPEDGAEDGASDPAVFAVADALTAAGLHCTADPAVEVAIWEKVAFNAAMNSLSAVTRLSVGPIGDAPEGRRLVRGMVDEVLAVARARGLPVEAARVHDSVARAFAGHRDHKASMLQDVLAGRRTEIESINGAVVAAGERLGVATPVTATMLALVRMIDAAACRADGNGVSPSAG